MKKIIALGLLALALAGCTANEEAVTSSRENTTTKSEQTTEEADDNSALITEGTAAEPDYETEAAELKAEGGKIPEESLSAWDFSGVKEKAVSKAYEENSALASFLDGIEDSGLKEAYTSAYTLMTVSYRDFEDFVNRELLRDYYGDDYESAESGAGTLYDENNTFLGKESGYTYASVYDAFMSTFTEEYALELLESFPLYCYGGELYYAEASNSRGLCSPEYSLDLKSNDKAVITEVCYALDEHGEKTEEIIYKNENSFILTDNGWRCEQFSLRNVFDDVS